MASSQVPGELLCKIVDHSLGDTPTRTRSRTASASPLSCATELATVNEPFRAAVDSHKLRYFHTFYPNGEPLVLGALNEWVPRTHSTLLQHSDYWSHHLGPDWPACTPLEPQLSQFDEQRPHAAHSVKVDVRLPGFSRARNCTTWTVSNFGTWMQSGAMLCRISPPNPRLRVLHLRISAQAEMYIMVETILTGCTGLTDIVIEDDSHPELDGLPRPILDFSSFGKSGHEEDYAQLNRLVIRAPSLRINAVENDFLFKRLKQAETLCLAVHDFIVSSPTWMFVHSLLSQAPEVKHVEVSTSDTALHGAHREVFDSHPISLPHLLHLSLDIPQLDKRLLERLSAPILKYVQLRSCSALGAYGDLPDNHFPALFCATLWCPGGSSDRFKALGLRRRQYIHNLSREQRQAPDVNEPILAYIYRDDSPPLRPDLATVERPYKRLRVGNPYSALRQVSSPPTASS
ncbi:hypothetical protein OC834_005851 [Tilletia horrida]|uniref:Uncharacterized protein n=1 Tax=Tilletia horrida TaxID=155126 RepID=A0AAN6GK47_9BASI|nr:hypothetical protein OC834_005851 [Tilletia horrida]KAK0540765.1 hypothetical protein OC842_000334 [Tilletia horrida]KAK0558249.1 hypothetical protein OC844_005300 [Tilletia horrida]